MRAETLEIAAREPIIDSDVACFRPSGRLQPFAKGRDAGACFRIILGEAQQEADPSNMLCLLCDDFKRPSTRAPNEADELASSLLTRRERIVRNPEIYIAVSTKLVSEKTRKI